MQLEKLHFFANDPAARTSERVEARAELEKIYAPTSSEMPTMIDMAAIRDSVLEWQTDEQFAKETQLQPRLVSPRSPREPKSVIVDELSGNCMAGGYWERPGLFGFDHLRLLVENTPIIQGVILRRQRQVSRFLRTWERGRDLYFKVCRSDDHNPGQGKRGKEEMALEQFILHSGWERNPIKMARLGREPLTATVIKGVRDLLTYGCWAIETVSTPNGRMIDGFNTIDGSTVRLASEQGYDGDDQVMAVQVVNGLPQTTYS